MKKTIKLFMASCCTLMAYNVFAVDGTIDIRGRIISDTCSIDINQTGNNATVVLPDVSVNALASAGAVAGSTDINFRLSGCPKNTVITANFEANNVDPNTGNLTNNAAVPAGNVQVQVLNRDGDVIDLRTGSRNFQYLEYLTDDTGSVALRYLAQYAAVDGGATAGDVNTQLVYSLEYR